MELEQLLAKLDHIVTLLGAGHLTQGQALHVARQALPNFVTALLKVRFSEALSERLNQSFQLVLEATVAVLRRSDLCDVVESATRILTDSASFQFYCQPPQYPLSSCDLDSQSSGSGSSDHEELELKELDSSGSLITSLLPKDDVSPFYLRNVEFFHRAGGFHLILERLARKPMLSLQVLRMLLKPFARVQDVLRKGVLQGFSETIHRVLVDYVQAMLCLPPAQHTLLSLEYAIWTAFCAHCKRLPIYTPPPICTDCTAARAGVSQQHSSPAEYSQCLCCAGDLR